MTQPAPTFQPLYLQIKALLERSLDAGEWRPGEAIPSEHELAGRFGVSQGTVRKAIGALAAGNLVIRRQGKGTFVATHTEEQSSSFRFLRIRRNDGVDEYPASRLVDVRRSKASAEVARLLDLEPGEGVILLDPVRRADAACRGKAARGRRPCDERAAASNCARDAASCGRPDHAHVRRAAGRMAARPLHDGAAPLFQSSGLNVASDSARRTPGAHGGT